jgi:hypothetical protein
MGQCDNCHLCHHGRHELPETEPPEIVATTSEVWGDMHDSDWMIVERLQECPFELETASTYVNCCKQFVMIAVKCDGRVLKFASNEIRDDEEVVSCPDMPVPTMCHHFGRIACPQCQPMSTLVPEASC